MRVVTASIGLLPVALGACSSQPSGACATQVAPEVCQTPANLRGAAIVNETWTPDPPPELVPQRLFDARYVETARTLYCAHPPPELSSLQAVLEISGCVMRLSTVLAPGAQPLVEVQTFDYAADGTLDSRQVCVDSPRTISGVPYGFDGTTLLLPDRARAQGPDGQAYDCLYIDTWEPL